MAILNHALDLGPAVEAAPASMLMSRNSDVLLLKSPLETWLTSSARFSSLILIAWSAFHLLGQARGPQLALWHLPLLMRRIQILASLKHARTFASVWFQMLLQLNSLTLAMISMLGARQSGRNPKWID